MGFNSGFKGLNGKKFGWSQTFSRINTSIFSNLVILHTYPPMKMKESVLKRRDIKFRRRGITQKKAYNIQNTAKVWNQEKIFGIHWRLGEHTASTPSIKDRTIMWKSPYWSNITYVAHTEHEQWQEILWIILCVRSYKMLHNLGVFTTETFVKIRSKIQVDHTSFGRIQKSWWCAQTQR